MRPLTSSCFLLLVLRRLFLLALSFLPGICLPSLWSPPFPLHDLALIHPFLAKVRLSPTLILFSLMIWCFKQTALFLFLLARAAPAYLPTAVSVALTPLFPIRLAQYVLVYLLKPTSFCTLFAGSSTIKSAISLLFYYLTLVFCPRHPVLFSIVPLISNSVADLAGIVFSLLLFYQATMGPLTLVFPGDRYG